MASEVAADAAPARPGEPAVPAAPPLSAETVAEPPVRAPLPDRPVVRRPDDVGSEPGDDSGSPRRRVRDRLARRIVAGQRSTVVRPVLEPLAALGGRQRIAPHTVHSLWTT